MHLNSLDPALPSHVVLLGDEAQHLILYRVVRPKLELSQVVNKKVKLGEY